MPRCGRHPSQGWRTFLYNQAVAVTICRQTEGLGIANRIQVLLEDCQHNSVRTLLIRLAEACSEISRSAATLQLALQIVCALLIPASPDHGINDCVRQLPTAARHMRSVRSGPCLRTTAARRTSSYRSRASPQLRGLSFRNFRRRFGVGRTIGALCRHNPCTLTLPLPTGRTGKTCLRGRPIVTNLP